MRLSRIKNKSLIIGLCVGFWLVMFFLTVIITTNLGDGTVYIGNVNLSVSGINGCIQAICFVLCILMVLIDYKVGLRVAAVGSLLMIMGIVRSMIITHSLESLPGIFFCLIQLSSLFFISRQYAMAEKAEITDKVTGIPNRNGFEEVLKMHVRLRKKGYLVYLQLVGFTRINASMGRNFGDELLRAVTSIMKRTLGNDGTIYKIDGAGFAILLSEKCDCMDVVERLVEELEAGIRVHRENDSMVCYLAAYVGITDCMSDNVSADTLMKNADSAVSYAVKSSNMKICIYDETIRKTEMRKMELERLIKEGLKNKYFYLMYQPQYFLKERKIRGFETLIRMGLPDGTIVSPGEFIAVAEESDLILEIDDFVLKSAMQQFGEVCRNSKVILSVNVSAKNIAKEDFARRLVKMIEKADFPGKQLEIEITEYSFAETMNYTVQNIHELKKHGVMVALDDFGTGYTSLSQVLNLPVDLLKIDKSLIDNISDNHQTRDFINTVIYMGHLMECEVISEGVETEAQLERLREMGCDFVQGFVWGRPLSYEVAVNEVESNK